MSAPPGASLTRRTVVSGVCSLGLAALTGCTADESGPEIAYEISGMQGVDDVPDGVVEHPNPEGFAWVAVTVEIVSGELPAADLHGLTQIEVGDTVEAARAVDVADGPLLAAGDDGPVLEEGDSATVYYRLPQDVLENEGAGGGESGSDDPEVSWVTDQLENEHGGLERSQGD